MYGDDYRKKLDEEIDNMEANTATNLNLGKERIDVEKAYNTFIYGAGYAGGETYDSILEIPDDILRDCIVQIDYCVGNANGNDLYAQVASFR